MKLEPILTEKTLDLAKEGKYTFRVTRSLNKYKARKLVEDTFGVHVVSIHSMNEKQVVKKTLSGRKKITQPEKKIIVKLKEKEKIDLFESKK